MNTRTTSERERERDILQAQRTPETEDGLA